MRLICCAVVLSSLLAAFPACAATKRTFVSVGGVNNPTCLITSPCRDFATALAATSPDGEVIVLDSGGYGAVTISQSASIIAPPGVYAGISVFAGDGVTVAAGPAGKVTLRGLTINGQGGNNGIVVTSGAEVNIEQCIVANLGVDGIRIDGGGSVHIRGSLVRSNTRFGLFVAAGTPEVHAIDSQFSRNGGHGVLLSVGTFAAARIAADDNGDNGVRLEPAAGVAVVATLTDSTFSGNTMSGAAAAAQFAGTTTRLAIARSTAARNGGAGFGANSFNVGATFLTVADSASLENVGNGVVVNGTNSIGVVSNSTVAGNTSFDLDQKPGAVLRTSQTNELTGRGAPDVNGALTPNPLR